jgi:uncharacterized protein
MLALILGWLLLVTAVVLAPRWGAEPALYLRVAAVLLLQPILSVMAAIFCGLQGRNPLPKLLLLQARQLLLWLLPTALALGLGFAWYRRGGGLAAALLSAGLLAAVVLGVRRQWLGLSTLIGQPQASGLRSLAQAHQKTLWATAKVESQFFSAGIWVNLALVALLALPMIIFNLPKLQASMPLPWLGYGLILAPALHALIHTFCAAAQQKLAAPAQNNALAESFANMPESDDETTLRAGEIDESIHAKLQRSVAEGNLPQVQKLLGLGANPNAVPELSAIDQRTPLVLAAGTGQLPILRALIAGGADVNQLSCGITPLLAATRDSWSGRFDVVMALLTNGADVAVQDQTQATALHGAARSRDVALVQLLIDSGAALDAIDATGYTPIARAVEASNAPVTLALAKAGAMPDVEGAIPLVHACVQAEHPAPELLKYLRQRANLSALDASGQGALHAAARADAAELAEMLMGSGPLLGIGAKALDQAGRTPLMLAAMTGSLRVLRLIALHRPDANIGDAEGNTALHLAAANPHTSTDVLQQLHALGADPTRKNRNGKRASELAMAAGRWDLARLLATDGSLPEGLDDTLALVRGQNTELAGQAVANPFLSDPTRPDLFRPDPFMPDPGRLALSAAQEGRIPLLLTLLQLGSLPAPVLTQIVVALGDELVGTDSATLLPALRRAGLQLGQGESEPVLCALARQVPPHYAVIAELLRLGASIAADSEGDSALILLCGAAAELEGVAAPLMAPPPVALILQLIAAGCDSALQGADGRSALSFAAQWCEAPQITALLASKAELNSLDQDGQSPLLRVLARHDVRTPALIKAMICAGCDPSLRARDGTTPRGVALAQNDLVLADLLNWPPGTHPGRALHGADLIAAAARKDVQALPRLLELGLDVNTTDAHGLSALTHAAGTGDSELIELLLKAGSDVNHGARITPLIAAVRGRHVACVRRLATQGAQLDAAPDGVLSPVNLAAGLLDLDMLSLLLELGADAGTRATDMSAFSACMHALLAGAECSQASKILDLLAAHGADIDRPDAMRRAPLMLLVGGNQEKFARELSVALLPALRQLIRLGCNVQSVDANQRNALHWCCKHGLFEAAEVLLDAGCDSMQVDEFRKLPADMAGALNRHDFNALFRA